MSDTDNRERLHGEYEWAAKRLAVVVDASVHVGRLELPPGSVSDALQAFREASEAYLGPREDSK